MGIKADTIKSKLFCSELQFQFISVFYENPVNFNNLRASIFLTGEKGKVSVGYVKSGFERKGVFPVSGEGRVELRW